jgi:hypothetical protein
MKTKIITIANDFTGRKISVDVTKRLTARKLREWNSKLHAKGCESGDELGGRGEQEHDLAYRALRARARSVIASGRDESPIAD